MARSGRMSVFLCETERARGEEAQEEADKGRLTRDVGRCSMSQPLDLLQAPAPAGIKCKL